MTKKDRGAAIEIFFRREYENLYRFVYQLTGNAEDSKELFWMVNWNQRDAEIRKMRSDSWEIRSRLAELERDIETYARATSALAPTRIPPFDDLWKAGRHP